MKITVWVIGIGSGHPHHLTGEAIEAMNAVDVFLVADKGQTTQDLAVARERLCAAVIGHDHYRVLEIADPPRDRAAQDYDAAVRRWHGARATRYRAAIMEALPGGGTVGFLVWGDPAFYDSTIRVAEALAGPDLEVNLQVVPGISSPQLLAAAHRIVLNQVGRPVLFTTGRRLVADFAGRPVGQTDVLVMLDGGLACAELVSHHPDLVVYWGAQLGLDDECLIAGQLADVLGDIERERARIRASRGWVLDTYLLRLRDFEGGEGNPFAAPPRTGDER